MKRPFPHAGLIVAGALALALGQAGCHQAARTESAGKATKPDDPMAWSEKDLVKGDPESGAAKSGLPKSSRLQGMMSDEAKDIESSLGVGRR